MSHNVHLNHHWARLWHLDEQVVFLNHGSFGACPKEVLAYQQQIRDRLEQEPLRFYAQDYEPLLNAARQRLATFVGADPQDLVFVPNATTGVNAVLRSLCGSPLTGLRLQPGDELLTTDHEYNACRNVLDFVASQTGATVIVATVPFPTPSAAAIAQAILACVTPRTRLALLDHVTSQTGLVMPLAVILQALAAQGIETLVDGAHAPGMIALNLAELGATYYTGNCHKWLCAPKGAAFLYVQRDRQSLIRPVTISHGANSTRTDCSRFHLEFDWVGTLDPGAWLAVPEALRYMGELLPGGWSALMAHNHQLALAGRQILCDRLQVAPAAPADLIGSMAVIHLPAIDPQQLYNRLVKEFRIQVPVMQWFQPPQYLLRISAQIYNHQEQYCQLAEALTVLLR